MTDYTVAWILVGAAGLGVGAHVRLVEDEHRGGAAVPDGHEVPLDPPQVEVVVEAAHDKHGVDVGGDELPAGRLAGRLAREAVAARQHRLDGRAPVRAGADADPVADHRAGVAAGRTVAQPPRDLGHHLAVGGAELIEGVVGDGDAGRPQAAVTAGPKLGLEPVVPPQGLERQHIVTFPAAGNGSGRLDPKGPCRAPRRGSAASSRRRGRARRPEAMDARTTCFRCLV